MRILGQSFGAFALLVLIWSAGCPAKAADPALELLGRGLDAYRVGDLAAAVKNWNEAVRLCNLTGDTAIAVEALARRAEALQSLGFATEASADLAEALRLAERRGESSKVAAIAGALGNSFFHVRDFERAEALLLRSLALSREQDFNGVRAASANNFANLLAVTNRRDEALRAYDEALEFAERVGDNALVATAATNKARLLDRAEHRQVLMLLRRADERLEREPPSRTRLFARLSVGRLAAQTSGDPGLKLLAYSVLRGAAIEAEERGDKRGLSLSYGYLGELFATEQRHTDAALVAARAIQAAQQIDAPDLVFRWEWLNARLLVAAADPERALAAFRRSLAALRIVRQDIPVEYRDGRSSFRETIGPLYFEVADLLIKQAKASTDAARRDALLTEARDTIENLKTAELRDYFKDQCIIDLEARAKSVEEVGRSVAAIYPIILKDRLELLVSIDGRIRLFTVPVGEQRITLEVRRLRYLLEKRSTREYLVPARQIYQWLIKPLENELEQAGVETLVIIPDGALRTIPLAALHDGRGFLLRRYAVATAPALKLTAPKELAPAARRRALLAGISVSVQDYPALPAVDGEIAAIAKLQRTKTLLNSAFRVSPFQQELSTGPYSVVHIASHGEFGSNPSDTFILTFDGKLTLDMLERAVKQSGFGENSLELLVLSACRTATGDDRAALGLGGIAVKAGAKTAVASLWAVDDEATSILIQEFYGRLGAGETKAQALRNAQIDLIESGRFRHPAYWAAFIMIGNWL
jgi:CHAT domain-containing protein